MVKDRKAGVLIPVFSLKSHKSFGVGEFADLMLLADWAKKVGFSLIQLLPFFDTSSTQTWLDSYCYSAISMFALHPIYLRIEDAFPNIPKAIQAEMQASKNRLNNLEDVDYEAVYQLKMDLCERLYKQAGNSFLSAPEFVLFMERNQSWIAGYAAFCVLRDKFGSGEFCTWGKYAQGTQAVIDQICDAASEHYERVCFYYFLQFQLDLQLKKASLYAQTQGVFLKGDYPVGVHVHSVECWMLPELFVLEKRIGAPPDCFNRKGQNWDLLVYNWEEVEKSRYSWFVRRMQHIEKYCQLIRIDHILGYFRFWEIPARCSRGALGVFNPSLALSVRGSFEGKDRYCKPFITDEILLRYFKDKKQQFIDRYFEEIELGYYRFKAGYQQQKAIEQIQDISSEEKERLHELYENVLLVEDEDIGNLFYPRIGFENTYSFDSLDQERKEFCERVSDVYSSKEQEEIWKREGLKKLAIFQQSTRMEICAEDLGMVPKCAETVLKELQFLRLHIQRMPKKEEEKFSSCKEYEYLSVCSPSNHDTSTLRMWWEENPEDTQMFYEEILQEKGKAPEKLSESLCEKIIQMHLDSDSKWAIFMLQDLLAMRQVLCRKDLNKERINDPSIQPFYWRWRLHLYLEDLLEEKDFMELLRYMLLKAGRM